MNLWNFLKKKKKRSIWKSCCVTQREFTASTINDRKCLKLWTKIKIKNIKNPETFYQTNSVNSILDCVESTFDCFINMWICLIMFQIKIRRVFILPLVVYIRQTMASLSFNTSDRFFSLNPFWTIKYGNAQTK